MCLIVFGWRCEPGQHLIVAANRDEFHARPTEAAHWWDAPERCFGGRDLRAGGTWCALDRAGRFAAVTNVREPGDLAAGLSRGALVRDYFAQSQSAAQRVAALRDGADAYGPFNLLVGDTHTLWFVSNRGTVRERRLEPGVHAISNGHWGEHWPKTDKAETGLKALCAAGRVSRDALFTLLADNDPAPVGALPDTGVPRERERFLSPLFIRSADYGTRASTVIHVDEPAGEKSAVRFEERGFDPAGIQSHRVLESWQITQDNTP